MGKFLFDNFVEVQHLFAEASDAIDLDFKKLCFTTGEAELALTENTQPALLLVSTACQQVLRSQFDLNIAATAGHSVGEFASLVLAESLSFSDAIKAVRFRGQVMQSAVAVGQGGMCAVLGLESEQVEKLCQYVVEKSGFGPLSPANYNSPGQIVISGSTQALKWLKEEAKVEDIFGSEGPRRLKLIPLQVSAPFHCKMMNPAEEKMRDFLSKTAFADAKIPVLQNYTAEFQQDAKALRENLIRQISAPVKWTQSMNLLKTHALTTCIECGAGSVLKGLLKKIDSESFRVFNTNGLEDIEMIRSFIKTGA